MNTRRLELFRYIYLDTEGIDSLFAQTEEWIETERSLVKGTAKKEGLVAKLGIGSPLAFLQLLKADFRAQIDRETDEHETSKYVLASEQKLKRLFTYLEEAASYQFVTDIEEAASTTTSTGRPVFLKAFTVFDIPQFYSGRSGADSMDKTETVIWRKPSVANRTYEEGDAWFRRSEGGGPSIVMTTSIYKFPSLRVGSGGKVRTSHFSVVMASHRGINIPVNVFGVMTQLPDSYHIKPYAIWH